MDNTSDTVDNTTDIHDVSDNILENVGEERNSDT